MRQESSRTILRQEQTVAALQIQIRARRYVAAVEALYEARRCWHRLDAALVEQKDPAAALAQAWEILPQLDGAIADATASLLRR